MKKTLIIAMAATGLALAGPVAAHHNIPDEDQQAFVEDQMNDYGLLMHNIAVGEVLDRDMDPANAPQGNACTDLLDNTCDPGNTDTDRRGMEREPWIEIPIPAPEM